MTASAPAAPRSAALLHRLGALGLFAGVLAAACRRLGDFDLPWHLATGRALFTGAPPVEDFSYTLRGTPLDREYIGDGLLYLADRAAGPAGLQCLAALSVGLLVFFLVARARAFSAPPRSPDSNSGSFAIAIASLALIVSGSWLVVRPALVSFTLLSLVLYLIDRHRSFSRGTNDRDPSRRATGLLSLALVIPLQFIYAATHGFAPLGALLVAGYALYCLLCALLRGRLGAFFPVREGRRSLAVLAIAGLATVATALGPHGTAVFTLPFRMRGYESQLTEWTPTTLAFIVRHDPALFLLALATLAALVFGREPDDDDAASRVPSACDLGLTLFALLLGAASVRLIPLAAIVVAPLAARRLASAFAAARTAPLLVAVTGLAVAPALLLSPGTRPGFGLDTKNLPEAATRFIAAAHPVGPLFNFLPFGGHLIYRLHPAVRVFVDGRTGWVYPRAFVDAALRAEHDPVTFAALDEKYRFAWAVERSSPGERFGEPLAADPSFTLVFLDETAAVYVKRDGENAALAASGYQLLRHLTAPGEILARVLAAAPDRAFTAALDSDARLAVAQAPDSTRAHVFAAAAALARNDRPALLAERARIELLDADYPGLIALDQALSTLR